MSEAALDRVRKLLALAESANVHEAAAAASRAQALIAKHRLQRLLDAEEAEENDPDPIADARDEPLMSGRRIRVWKTILASALADLNGCQAYTLAQGRDRSIVLIGRSRDRAAVHTLWTWLVRRIEWLSATHATGKSRAWHKAFRIGAVQTITERLRTSNQDATEVHEDAALVRVNTALQAHERALQAFVASRMRIKRGRGVRIDAQAYERGREAGRALDLPLDPQAG